MPTWTQFSCVQAILLPQALLEEIGYRNARNYRRFQLHACQALLGFMGAHECSVRNVLAGDPVDFERCDMRYSGADNRLH